MAENFFNRLREYYLQVGAVLRGEASTASIFPNTTDIGMSRERIYVEFLRQHTPSKCNTFLGGFLFDMNGQESRQLDVIVTTDTAPRFDLHNKDGGGKSFSPVEGTLAVVSIKSTLDKRELFDSLNNIASIPLMESLEGRLSFTTEISNYDDWPYKIIYASDGISGERIDQYLDEFYATNEEIPIFRRPNIIHVAGKYVIVRMTRGMKLMSRSTREITKPPLGTFHLITSDPDLHGIVWVLNMIQQNAQASTDILFSYGQLIEKVHLLS